MGEDGEYRYGLLLQKQVQWTSYTVRVGHTARERLITNVELALNVKARVQFTTVNVMKCQDVFEID